MKPRKKGFIERLALSLPDSLWLSILVIVLPVILVGGLLMGGCGMLADQGQAERVLRKNGFTHIKLVHRDVFFVTFKDCNKDDVARFEFRATNARGDRVTIHVCESWPFGGATIRE